MLTTMEKEMVKIITIDRDANFVRDASHFYAPLIATQKKKLNAKRKYENEVVAAGRRKPDDLDDLSWRMRVTVDDHRRQYFAALWLIGTVAYLRVAMSSVKRAL